MVYLDNAATTYPKPLCVRQAMQRALTAFGANPGRGGYPMAIETAQALYRCRERAAALFGLSDPQRVIFTRNCTEALNIVLKSLLAGGGRAVISNLEHNAVVRPLHALSPSAPRYDTAQTSVGDDDATVAAFSRAITPQTRVLVCTHASNVLGVALPVARLAALAHRHGIPIVVDAAQSAGVLPIHMARDGLDYVCAAGHKGLYGPMGTGLLLCGSERPVRPLIEGGTGSLSLSPLQPEELPDRLESGTQNVAGICGLSAALAWLAQNGVQRIARHEQRLCAAFYEELRHIERVRLYAPPPAWLQSTATLSLTVEGMETGAVAERLAARGIAVRAGLHCAPLAHRACGTLPAGTVRFSFGAFNTAQEVERCVRALRAL